MSWNTPPWGGPGGYPGGPGGYQYPGYHGGYGMPPPYQYNQQQPVPPGTGYGGDGHGLPLAPPSPWMHGIPCGPPPPPLPDNGIGHHPRPMIQHGQQRTHHAGYHSVPAGHHSNPAGTPPALPPPCRAPPPPPPPRHAQATATFPTGHATTHNQGGAQGQQQESGFTLQNGNRNDLATIVREAMQANLEVVQKVVQENTRLVQLLCPQQPMATQAAATQNQPIPQLQEAPNHRLIQDARAPPQHTDTPGDLPASHPTRPSPMQQVQQGQPQQTSATADIPHLTWEQWYEQLIQFKQTHGHCCPQFEHGNKLYFWACGQRTQAKHPRYDDNKRVKLDAIGFIWDLREHNKWKKYIQRLKQHIKANDGRFSLPPRDKELHIWFRAQIEEKSMGLQNHAIISPTWLRELRVLLNLGVFGDNQYQDLLEPAKKLLEDFSEDLNRETSEEEHNASVEEEPPVGEAKGVATGVRQLLVPAAIAASTGPANSSVTVNAKSPKGKQHGDSDDAVILIDDSDDDAPPSAAAPVNPNVTANANKAPPNEETLAQGEDTISDENDDNVPIQPRTVVEPLTEAEVEHEEMTQITMETNLNSNEEDKAEQPQQQDIERGAVNTTTAIVVPAAQQDAGTAPAPARVPPQPPTEPAAELPPQPHVEPPTNPPIAAIQEHNSEPAVNHLIAAIRKSHSANFNAGESNKTKIDPPVTLTWASTQKRKLKEIDPPEVAGMASTTTAVAPPPHFLILAGGVDKDSQAPDANSNTNELQAALDHSLAKLPAIEDQQDWGSKKKAAKLEIAKEGFPESLAIASRKEAVMSDAEKWHEFSHSSRSIVARPAGAVSKMTTPSSPWNGAHCFSSSNNNNTATAGARAAATVPAPATATWARAATTVPAPATATVGDLSEELLFAIWEYLSILDLRQMKCVCCSWRQVLKKRDLRLLLVTCSGANELVLLSTCTSSRYSFNRIVQRVSVSPKGTKKHQTRQSPTNSAPWPTCLALGPKNMLFVSHYQVQGVRAFSSGFSQGYEYQKVLASHPKKLECPEGLVVGHNCVYIASVTAGHIVRLSLSNGALKETAGPMDGPCTVHNWTLWGMTLSPCKSFLLIAGHLSDGGENVDVRQPTPTNNGAILRLDLEDDGSFRKNSQGEMGYYPMSSMASLQLNRPSHLQFCQHGFLHVATYCLSAVGGRRIQKCKVEAYHDQNPNEPFLRHVGWLQEADNIAAAWGISFSQMNDGVFITSSTCGRVYELKSCGCSKVVEKHHQVVAKYEESQPQAISCGELTVLADGTVFDQPANVLALD